jgi:Flp pilus assembly protein TadG
MRVPTRQPHSRPGAALIETAFIFIVLVVFMFGIFEFGRYMMARQIVENAARAGARQAVTVATSYISSSTATTTVTNTITQNLAGQNLQNLNVQIYQSDTSGNNIGSWTTAPFGGPIVVQIDGDLPILFPKIDLGPHIPTSVSFLPNNGAAPNSVHITAKVMMLSEAN